MHSSYQMMTSRTINLKIDWNWAEKHLILYKTIHTFSTCIITKTYNNMSLDLFNILIILIYDALESIQFNFPLCLLFHDFITIMQKVNIIKWVAWIMHRGMKYLVTCSQKSFWQLYLHNTTEKSPCHTQGHSPFWGLLPIYFYIFQDIK